MKLILFIFGLLYLLGDTSAQTISVSDVKPGIRLRVTDAGLKFAADREIAGLIKRLRGQRLNDVSGRGSIIIGTIDYKLSDISNQNVVIPVSSFTTVPGLGLRFRASQIDVAFNGNWWYEKRGWFRFEDKGRFTLEGKGIAFNLKADVGRSSDGRPTISSAGCSASVDKVKIKFQGGSSWLYNLFSSTMERELEKNLQDMICSAAKKAIDEKAAKELKAFPVQKKVNRFAMIDYSFIEDPYFATHYLDALLKGEFESTNNHTQAAAIDPISFGNSSRDTKMVYLWLSDYTLDTAAIVFHEAGLLTKTITGENAVDSGFSFNTKFFELSFFKLYQLYHDRPIEMKLLTTAPPRFSSDVGGMTVTINGNVEFYVISNQNDSVPVFTLSAVIVCGLTLGVHESNLTVHVNSFKFNLHPVSSQIGNSNMNINFLQMFVNQFLGNEILKELNKYGDVGFPLPTMDRTYFVNTQVTSGKKFTLLAADLEYTAA